MRRLRQLPSGLTGKTLVLAGRLPPWLFGVFMNQMRLRAVRRLPIAFGWLTRRGDAATARWMRPVMTQSGIRRDAVKTLRSAGADPRLLVTAAESLPGFTRPVLVVWASEDRVMPPSTGGASLGSSRTPAGRDSRQLHAHPPGPAGQARPGRPRICPRIQPGLTASA